MATVYLSRWIQVPKEQVCNCEIHVVTTNHSCCCHQPPFLKHCSLVPCNINCLFPPITISPWNIALFPQIRIIAIIGTMQSSMVVDLPTRLDKHVNDLCTNYTQKHRSVCFSLSSTLYTFLKTKLLALDTSWRRRAIQANGKTRQHLIHIDDWG